MTGETRGSPWSREAPDEGASAARQPRMTRQAAPPPEPSARRHATPHPSPAPPRRQRGARVAMSSFATVAIAIEAEKLNWLIDMKTPTPLVGAKAM